MGKSSSRPEGGSVTAAPQKDRGVDVAPKARTLNPSLSSLQMLLALNRSGKPIYNGSVPGAVKAKRRARGKAARASRRLNRGR